MIIEVKAVPKKQLNYSIKGTDTISVIEVKNDKKLCYKVGLIDRTHEADIDFLAHYILAKN